MENKDKNNANKNTKKGVKQGANQGHVCDFGTSNQCLVCGWHRP